MQDLRGTVLQWTGIPVSVGVAPTKTLAKVANRLAKKDPASQGVKVLMEATCQEAALAKLELTDLWGVARRLSERLKEQNIKTPLALRVADPKTIRQNFGVVGERIVSELRGIPCIDIEEVAPNRKSLIASRSFGRPVETLNEMQDAVAAYASRAAEKMRRQGLSTANLLVFIETNPFKKQDRQYRASQSVQLPIATSDTGRLVAAAKNGLRRIWAEGYKYKKAGVMLLDLVPASDIQGSLFDLPDTPASLARMRAFDAINRRYGRDTLVIGRTSLNSGWKLRRDYISNRYTTSWSELLKV